MPHTYKMYDQADGSCVVRQYSVQGKTYSRNIDYPDLVLAMSEPGTPRVERFPYVAPPPITDHDVAMEQLANTDYELLMAAARTIEDIIDEREEQGKFVRAAVKSKIAERRGLRKRL